MRRHGVVVMGAGFSRCAGGPLLDELLTPDWIRRSIAARPTLTLLSHRLAELGGANSTNVEAIFTQVWQEARTGGTVTLEGRRFDADELLRELVVHLSGLAAGITLRANSSLGRMFQRYLLSWVDEFSDIKFVTFNYDLLVEKMLDAAGVTYDEGGNKDFAFVDRSRERDVERRGSGVTVLKLHGSVSWGLCRGCRQAEVGPDVVGIFERPYIPLRHRSCAFCGDAYVEPGIIPPIAGKAGELGYMVPVWRDARSAMARADRLEIVGYSLPNTDAEAASLLREARNLIEGGAVTAICGEHGASARLRALFPRLVDQGTRFEDYLRVHFPR